MLYPTLRHRHQFRYKTNITPSEESVIYKRQSQNDCSHEEYEIQGHKHLNFTLPQKCPGLEHFCSLICGQTELLSEGMTDKETLPKRLRGNSFSLLMLKLQNTSPLRDKTAKNPGKMENSKFQKYWHNGRSSPGSSKHCRTPRDGGSLSCYWKWLLEPTHFTRNPENWLFKEFKPSEDS